MSEVATQAVETAEPAVVKNSPNGEQFAEIWNASESRKDALARFAAAGYDVSYSAMVARVKSYKTRGVSLKDIPSAPRGRRLDVDKLNAAIAEKAAAASAAE